MATIEIMLIKHQNLEEANFFKDYINFGEEEIVRVVPFNLYLELMSRWAV